MQLDKSRLLEFLKIVDEKVKRKITVVAVGGTAMTLLNLKPSTIDIDFTAPSEDKTEFQRALRGVSHGFKIDTWPDGTVFSQTLPDDYLEKSIEITMFKHIQLKSLHPVDIIVTKIGRLDKRDLQDVKTCIKEFNISKEQLKKRAEQVQYAGKEENYLNNLNYVLENLF